MPFAICIYLIFHRVKELKGQGGPRGGRKGKTIPSPKRNLSNSSSGGSSVGTRGKSSPKKPKLGRQREAFGPTTLTSRLATGGAILCSTPKSSRWEEETSAIERNGIGFEEITPIRCLLEIGGERERRERTGGREDRRTERYRGADSAGHPTGDQNIKSGLIMGQETDEHLQQSTLKGGREGGRRWIEPRRQVKSSRDTCTEVERLREGHLQKIDESDKERERHLRRYHQQLQQFMPSSASSSDHLLSPSTCLSFSSSNPVSLSSSVPPSSCSSLQHSPLKYHGLEEVCRARVKIRTDGSRGQLSSFPRGGICLQTVTSPSYSNNKDEAGRGDSGGSEDWRACLEGTEAGFGQDRGKGEKRRSLKVRVEGEVRGRREDWRPAGKEEGGERKWAWVATAHTEQADRMTGARPADVEAQVFYDRDSEVGEEGPDASAVTADGVWSAEERGGDDGYALVSSHSNNDSSSLFDNSPVESPHQRAPAERPLSPACEHTNTLLTPNKLSDLSLELKHTRCTSNTLSPLIQNAQQGVPSSRDRELQFAANANRREFSNAQSVTLPLTIPFTQNGCKIPAKPLNILSENPAHTQAHDHPDVKAEMPVLSQGETSTDSVSCTMDPLSISLLQVDQEVATASFLQAEQNNTSLCPLENERAEDKKREVEKEGLTCAEMAGKVVEDEDVEFCLSLLELPQAMTHCPPTSHHMTATDHSEQRKDECFATCEYCGIGMFKF